MNKKIFFSGLNELRCIAALCVTICHIEGFKKKANIPNILDFPYIQPMGYHGVLLFFVLSGFLITFLALQEINDTNSINIHFFYARRALRIWPLYILCILIAYALIPYTQMYSFFNFYMPMKNEFSSIILQSFLAPNYLLFQHGHILGVGVLWSIAVEEQFYLIQPHILKIFRRNLTRNLILLTLCLFAIRLFLYILYLKSGEEKVYLSIFKMLCFEPLLIGSTIASMYFEENRFLKFFYMKSIQYISLIILLIGLYLREFYHPFTEIAFGLIYAVIVINTVHPENAVFRVKSSVMSYLGQISFGIYMLHSFIIAGVIVCGNFLTKNLFFSNAFFYSGSFLITATCAHYSYKYYESFFIGLKKKVTIIQSSNTAST